MYVVYYNCYWHSHVKANAPRWINTATPHSAPTPQLHKPNQQEHSTGDSNNSKTSPAQESSENGRHVSGFDLGVEEDSRVPLTPIQVQIKKVNWGNRNEECTQSEVKKQITALD